MPFQDLITRPSGTVASNRLYAEDNLGQVTQITDSPNPQYDRSLSYGGTAILPTMLASVTTGTALWGTASYTTANPQQNFVNAEDLVAESIGSTSLALTYDSNDHLTGIAPNGAASSPVTIDAARNQTTLNGTTYTYSPRNLLASGGGFTFGYDGFGKRLTSQTATNFEVSFYEGNSLTSESAYNSASIAYDYIWFGNTPVAQETLGATPVTF